MLLGLEAILSGSKATSLYRKAEKALDMVESGEPMGRVFRETGVDFIEDTNTFLMEVEYKLDKKAFSRLMEGKEVRLDDLIRSDELYDTEETAEAGGVMVQTADMVGAGFFIDGSISLGRGFFDPETGRFNTKQAMLIHEAQHAMQFVQDREFGSNPTTLYGMAYSMRNMDDPGNRKAARMLIGMIENGFEDKAMQDAYMIYLRSTGEVEANTVQARFNLKDRRSRGIEETYNEVLGDKVDLPKINFREIVERSLME